MIDVHIHILPGVDDGSYSMEESLRMARIAVDSGVTEMVVTPHCNLPDEEEPLWAADFAKVLESLRSSLRENNIPLKTHLGMEIFGTEAVPDLMRQGKLTTLNGSRYPLIEFPFWNFGQQATDILAELVDMGYRPLVAHPERYHFTQDDPRLLNLWVDMGCYLQINRGSLFGRFGQREQALAHGLLERNFVTCVASDAHRSTRRTPWLADAHDLICDRFSAHRASRLMEENPRRILSNQEIQEVEPDWF